MLPFRHSRESSPPHGAAEFIIVLFNAIPLHGTTTISFKSAERLIDSSAATLNTCARVDSVGYSRILAYAPNDFLR